MEYLAADTFKVLSNPGVASTQLLSPNNSSSKRVAVTRVRVDPQAEQARHTHTTSEQIWVALTGVAVLLLADEQERIFHEGDVVRFEEGDVHGLRNDSAQPFEYLSVTSPPIDFGYAYERESG